MTTSKAFNLSTTQQTVLDKIVTVGLAKGLTTSFVEAAVLFSQAESNFNPAAVGPTEGTTIRGLFQYSDGTWAISWKRFQNANPGNTLSQLSAAQARANVDAMIEVMYSDLTKYQSEFDSKHYPTAFTKIESPITGEGLPVDWRLTSLASFGVDPFASFLTYAYMRHNTNPAEIVRVLHGTLEPYGEAARAIVFGRAPSAYLITNYPDADIGSMGGTLVFGDKSTLSYDGNTRILLAAGNKSATVTQIIDATLGIQIEYRIDAFGQSSGGQLVFNADNPNTRRVTSFTDPAQIKVAPGGTAYLLNDGISGLYVNLAAGDNLGNGNGGRVNLFFDPATGQGNLYRQNPMNAGFSMEVIPAGSSYQMQPDGGLVITKPDNSTITVAAPGIAPPPGGAVMAGYTTVKEIAPGLYLGRNSAAGGAQMLYTDDTGDNHPALAWIAPGAKVEAFKTNPTDSYASVVLITDPASNAQTYYDTVTRTTGHFDRSGNGEFVLPDGTRQKVTAGEWYVTSNGSTAIYNQDGSVSFLSKVGDKASFATYVGPELGRLSALTQDQLGSGNNADGSPRVSQAGQVAWSTGSTPQEFADSIGRQLTQTLGASAQTQVDASKATLQQLTTSFGEPASATVLSNGTVLVSINGLKYAVNGADAAQFSVDEFNTLRLKVVAGANIGQEAVYDNFTAYASANPDSQLGGFITTSAVLQGAGASALKVGFAGVADESGALSYSGDVQYRLDSDGYIVGNEVQDVVATVSTGADSLTFDLNWSGNRFEVGVITSVNGQALAGGTTAISLQDAGLSLASLTNGDSGGESDSASQAGAASVERTLSLLAKALDPATQAATGAPTPQVFTTDLGNGLTQRSLELPNGATLATVRNDDRRILSVSETKAHNTFETSTNTYTVGADGSRVLTSQSSRTTAFDGTYTGVETDVLARKVYTVAGDVDGNPIRFENVDATNNLRQADTATVFSDVNGLIGAIKAGQPLPALASGLRLVNNLNIANGTPAPDLGAAAQVAAGALSFYNLYNAINKGDAFSKVNATLSTINYANIALNATAGEFVANSAAAGLNATLNGGAGGLLGNTVGVLPVLGLISAIKSGDPVGMAMSMGTLINPAFLTTPLGCVLIGVSVLQSLFGGGGPPKAWGVANVSYGAGFDNLQLQVNASGDSFGTDRARAGLQGTLDHLQGSVLDPYNDTHSAQQRLGLIAQRLPALVWRAADLSDAGYSLSEIDPLTGEQHLPHRRFDDTGRPFSAEPGVWQVDPANPAERANLSQAMLQAALNRGAIAPLWEVQTAKLQADAGAADAGLSEEERAAKAGYGAALDAAYAASHPNDPHASTKRAGSFMVVGLDLSGDGHISTSTLAQNAALNNGAGISFNWDGQSFQKRVGWIDASDGFLVLDRNFNQSVDSGTELLSNPLVSDAAKGLRSLAAWDANGDGRIDAADPVYAQLRVWQDFDQDGNNTSVMSVNSASGVQSYPVQDATSVGGVATQELRSLSELGITAIDYGNSRYEFNNCLPALLKEHRPKRPLKTAANEFHWSQAA